MFTEQDIQLNENIKKNLLPFPHPGVSSTMNNRVEKT